MKKILSLLCALALAVCGVGCGSQPAPSAASGGSSAPAPTAEPAPSATPEPEIEQYQLLGSSIIASPGGQGPQGMYDVWANSDGSGTILFYDYATCKLVPLSSEVNSNHNDETSTSYLPYVIGGTKTMCDDSYLYIVKQTNGPRLRQGDESGWGFACRSELNGQDRKTVRFPAETYLFPFSGAASCDGELYMLLMDAQEDGSDLFRLVAIDFDAGELRTAYAFDETQYPTLVGSCRRGLILVLMDQEYNFTLAVWNSTLDAPAPLGLDANQVEYLLDQETGAIYYTPDSAPDQIYAYDMETGQSTFVSQIPMPEGYVSRSFAGAVRDQHIFVRLSAEETYTEDGRLGEVLPALRYALDLETGEWKQQTLTYGTWPEEYDVSVYGCYQDQYLVLMGYASVEYKDYQPDGTPITNTAQLPQYALIDKEDYWANRPNYHEFENLAYEASDLDVQPR